MLPRERLERRAERLVKSLIVRMVQEYNPEFIVLYGSYATGSHMADSDIDICVVSKFLPEDIFERRTLYFKDGVQAVGFTLAEFEGMLESLNPFILDIVYYGKPIFGEEKFQRYKRRLNRMMEKGTVQKYGRGWRINR